MSKKISSQKLHTLINIIFVLFLVFIAGAFVKITQNYQVRSANFLLKKVYVKFENGSKIEDSEALKYLNLPSNISIFKINPQELSKHILKNHPEILKVSVYKKLPATLEVKTKNRIALAQIHLGQFYPLDKKGFILPFPSNFRIKGYPDIEGINPVEVKIKSENSNPKLSLALKILNLLKKNIRKDYGKISLDVSDLRNIVLFLPDGTEVKLGRNRFRENIRRLKLVLNDIAQKKINPASIDLRFEKVILIPK